MKGILFNLETGMLKSVIAGEKTMTRRLGGLEDVNEYPHNWQYLEQDNEGFCFSSLDGRSYVHCKPRYNVGEKLFVKESYCKNDDGAEISYKVDYEPNIELFKETGWTNAMFMPQSAARRFLSITNVRVERLQDLSKEDCIKEGITIMQQDSAGTLYKDYKGNQLLFSSPIDSFASLINKINGQACWSKNMWVFVYEYILVK